MLTQASKSSSDREADALVAGRRRPLVMASVVCAALSAAVGVALSISTLSSDKLVFGGFERAFASRTTPQDARRATAYDGIAASEDFWLHVAAGDQAKVINAVAVGREITVTNADGQRRLTVTGVRDVSQTATHISNRDGASRVLFLTCREADAGSVREIRLIMDDVGAEQPSGSAAPAGKGVPTT
jgi:predicted secreted protein